MAEIGETSTAAENTAATTYTQGDRGGGGKVRRERKPPATPYDRPSSSRPWISRIVDPAKRLFSGFPSIFSSSNLVDDVQKVAEEEDGFAEENCTLDPVVLESTGVLAPREDKGKSKLVISDEDGLDNRQGSSSGGIPDIEQLINGKTFSREEIDRLMKILHSRVVDVEQDRIAPSMKGTDGYERAETSTRRLKSSLDEEEELYKFKLATSTPLPRPTVQDEIGASPVDVAKAYMGSRTSEMGFPFTRSVQKTEKLGFTTGNLANSVMSSPLKKAPICWPGAITQNQQDYSTPLNRNNRSGLSRFSRTPYSRTVYSKSKSKLDPLRGDNERFPGISPAPFEPTANPFYEKVQLKNNVSENSYGTGGPIRRTREKFTAATPTRDSPLFTTARKSPFMARESTADIFPKKTFELGSPSKINIEPINSKAEGSEARVCSVHPHSNRLAWRILEQLDRPVTLKEHSKELSLAASQQDASVENNSFSSLRRVGVSISKDIDGVEHYGQTNKERNGLPQERSNPLTGAENVVSDPSISMDKTSSPSGVDNGTSPSFEKHSSEQGINNNLSKTSVLFGDPSKGAATITNNSLRSETYNSHRKPILPSIAVEKSDISASFSSITSLGFTFPVTTSSITSAEPPTPSVIPSFLTSPPQPKGSANLPTFNFGNKITIAPPVVAFSSKTASTINDVSAPKFKFGSEKSRLSFAVPGDDDTSTPSDTAIPKFKFGSGTSRLNFGKMESDHLCC